MDDKKKNNSCVCLVHAQLFLARCPQLLPSCLFRQAFLPFISFLRPFLPSLSQLLSFVFAFPSFPIFPPCALGFHSCLPSSTPLLLFCPSIPPSITFHTSFVHPCLVAFYGGLSFSLCIHIESVLSFLFLPSAVSFILLSPFTFDLVFPSVHTSRTLASFPCLFMNSFPLGPFVLAFLHPHVLPSFLL